MRRLSILATLLLIGWVGTAAAQSFNYADFANLNGLVLNGSASQQGTTLELHPNAASQWGNTFFPIPLAVETGFDMIMTFRITPSPGGGAADGMAFLIHGDPIGSGLQTGVGGPLGYGGLLTHALAVELDTYQNGWDTAGNEISVHTNGIGTVGQDEIFSLGRTISTFPLADGNFHTLRVEYAIGLLNVYLDNLAAPLLTIPFDFATGGTLLSGQSVGGLGLPQGAGWIGLSAATGAITEQTEIFSWQYTSTPVVDACYDGTVGATAGGPFDVLTINGSTGGFARRVTASVNDPLTISIAPPPNNPLPAPFLILGILGFPPPSIMYPTPVGTLCFLPSLAFPAFPGLFLYTDNLTGNPTALFPSSPAPWSLTDPNGLPFPYGFTFQGLISENNASLANITVTNAIELEIVPAAPPVIANITPPAPAGTVVTLNGTGFQPSSSVTVGGLPVATSSVTATQIMYSNPFTPICDTPVVVTNVDGQSATITYNPSPVITATPLMQGPVAGGTNFIIVGQNLFPGSTVSFAGVPATVVLNSGPNLINCIVPPGTLGPVSVLVTTPGGCTITANYTYI